MKLYGATAQATTLLRAADDVLAVLASTEQDALTLREAVRQEMQTPTERVSSIGVNGWGEIRTRETVARPHAFQACALSHSATHPDERGTRTEEAHFLIPHSSV